MVIVGCEFILSVNNCSDVHAMPAVMICWTMWNVILNVHLSSTDDHPNVEHSIRVLSHHDITKQMKGF